MYIVDCTGILFSLEHLGSSASSKVPWIVRRRITRSFPCCRNIQVDICVNGMERVCHSHRHSTCRRFSSPHQSCGFCQPGLPDFGDQLAEFDDRLFSRISCDQQHVLHRLLPPPSVASQNYDLRPRRHDRQLPAYASHLMDCEFVTRILYKHSY